MLHQIKAPQFDNMLHQIKAPQFDTNFLKLISLVMDSSIYEVDFYCVNQYFSEVFSP